ncbi:conserved hypothetical protein [Abyssogena phaseoliformis symbiont OG214]|uniref:hypothetical protein n=1 Tax=Abyssogena phaseoliformis symbiont TaxID=596095 RepID=UPI001936C3C2|nr:hypothetical protein [Abyssogena phaseoliformis symbiont]BBB23313.1 conserved hypothetical protein [Abyssogena phaseoliformis symbiont OG214]
MLTLWLAKEDTPNLFNKDKNIGLHYIIALEVKSEQSLNTLYQQLLKKHINIEFPPEQLGQGPAKRMMCYEPSGIRVEFIYSDN